MALSQGAGAEVQRPLARVVIGGPPAPDARRPTERPSGLGSVGTFSDFFPLLLPSTS
ncbi:MAG: hypothetical protein H0W30_17745 [Gemmatimonadaceae bacterium]|nr:hypothetical protein [Gemmatimonadaceae bacterium]